MTDSSVHLSLSPSVPGISNRRTFLPSFLPSLPVEAFLSCRDGTHTRTDYTNTTDSWGKCNHHLNIVISLPENAGQHLPFCNLRGRTRALSRGSPTGNGGSVSSPGDTGEGVGSVSSLGDTGEGVAPGSSGASVSKSVGSSVSKTSGRSPLHGTQAPTDPAQLA